MKDRPIPFNGPMVRAILTGRKTQTRRVVKDAAGAFTGDETPPWWITMACPHGTPGDRLWVRERVRRCTPKERDQGYPVAVFAADSAPTVIDTWPWKRDHLPSIHMPRGVCRLVLEVTEVRVQRLQCITGDDARAEGYVDQPGDPLAGVGAMAPLSWFRSLWDDINGDRASWASNPWVWAVTFRRIEAP